MEQACCSVCVVKNEKKFFKKRKTKKFRRKLKRRIRPYLTQNKRYLAPRRKNKVLIKIAAKLDIH